MMLDPKKLGNRLFHIRTIRHLSIDEVAKLAGITASYYRNLESGERTPTLETFIDLADVLNIDANHLLYDSLAVFSPSTDTNDEGARMFFMQPQAEIKY